MSLCENKGPCDACGGCQITNIYRRSPWRPPQWLPSTFVFALYHACVCLVETTAIDLRILLLLVQTFEFWFAIGTAVFAHFPEPIDLMARHLQNDEGLDTLDWALLFIQRLVAFLFYVIIVAFDANCKLSRRFRIGLLFFWTTLYIYALIGGEFSAISVRGASEICAFGLCFGTSYTLFTRPAKLQLVILMLKYLWVSLRDKSTHCRCMLILKPAYTIWNGRADPRGVWGALAPSDTGQHESRGRFSAVDVPKMHSVN